MIRTASILVISAFLLSANACDRPSLNPTGNTQKEASVRVIDLNGVRVTVDPKAKYLFYLHGRIIEDKGIRPTDGRFGVYEYEEILQTFRDRGFIVLSDARPKDSDVDYFAMKVVVEIQRLVNAGALARNMTVVGASKGAVIAMRVSTFLKDKNVNFVLLSNCNEWVDENFDIRLYGNVLSIYDINDDIGESCQRFFDKANGLNRHKEIVLQLGTGHAILYKPLNEWVDPVVEWAQ